MNCLIITGGKFPNHTHVAHELNSAQFIIAADSGYDTAKTYGIRVDEWIGDGDSVQAVVSDTLDFRSMFLHPREKAMTDTELCLRRAAERNADEIVLIGGGEGRLDHTISLLQQYSEWPYPKRWYTSLEVVHAVIGKEEFEVRPNTKVSVFNICQREPITVLSKGLRWELDAYPISLNSSSISNHAVSSHFTIDSNHNLVASHIQHELLHYLTVLVRGRLSSLK